MNNNGGNGQTYSICFMCQNGEKYFGWNKNDCVNVGQQRKDQIRFFFLTKLNLNYH